jgi:predicted dithiol-disulfide oxidoreductase (DUF899 family)
MTTSTVPHPPIVSREQWLDERKKLLVREKELTKHRDRINAERRRLPVSRAPLPKLEAYKAKKGWSVPWLSSFGSDFNYDFHVTNDEKVAPVEYNYRDKAEMEARKAPNAADGEEHGLSVFFRLDDEVFHTYSTYARGTESLTDPTTFST